MAHLSRLLRLRTGNLSIGLPTSKPRGRESSGAGILVFFEADPTRPSTVHGNLLRGTTSIRLMLVVGKPGRPLYSVAKGEACGRIHVISNLTRGGLTVRASMEGKNCVEETGNRAPFCVKSREQGVFTRF